MASTPSDTTILLAGFSNNGPPARCGLLCKCGAWMCQSINKNSAAQLTTMLETRSSICKAKLFHTVLKLPSLQSAMSSETDKKMLLTVFLTCKTLPCKITQTQKKIPLPNLILIHFYQIHFFGLSFDHFSDLSHSSESLSVS